MTADTGRANAPEVGRREGGGEMTFSGGTWSVRDVIAETLCNLERGTKGVGYFIRHGEQADAILAALAEHKVGFVRPYQGEVEVI